VIVPVILWVFDRLIRFYRSRFEAKVESAQCLGDCTNLKLSLGSFNFKAGDYCFIRIPEISLTQWHPFSISSPPPLVPFSFHILNMGRGTWTGALYEHVKAGRPIHVNVDGPHGRLEVPVTTGYSTVVLCAGGVGATPIMSIFAHLLDLHKNGQAKQLKSIHLVWSAKSASIIHSWFPVLLRSAQENKELCTLHLYASRAKESKNAGESSGALVEDGAALDVELQTGRPSFGALFDQFVKEDPDSVAVLVCGPQPMVVDVQNAALDRHFHFHKETFAL